MNLITQKHDLKDYQLLDSGEGQKLEVIGGIRVVRPSPQAIWKKKLNEKEWKLATSVCLRTKEGGGEWKHSKKPEKDLIINGADWAPILCQLKFTPFGHCGIFFEQIPVWKWLFDQVQLFKKTFNRPPKVLNLFGYTGAASLVMSYAGAQVFHVDSAKGVLEWGQQSEKLNKLEGKITWIHDDAQKFLINAYNKNNKFDGALLDPPSWGHGTKKEVWEFEKHISPLMDKLFMVLPQHKSFVFLSSHTHGVQAEALSNLLKERSFFKSVDSGDLMVAHELDDRLLPAGLYAAGTWV